jgi:hypothetical protein
MVRIRCNYYSGEGNKKEASSLPMPRVAPSSFGTTSRSLRDHNLNSIYGAGEMRVVVFLQENRVG